LVFPARDVELIFIRHAQPAWVDGEASRIDPVLSEMGRRQALALAEHAREWSRVDELFVSPTMRTRETSKPLAEALGLTPQIIDWFEELRLPSHWEGAPAQLVSELLRGSRRRTRQEWEAGIEGAESYAAFEKRIVTGLLSLLRERGTELLGSEHPGDWRIAHPQKRLVFVGHGGSNAVALGHLMGMHSVPWPWERLVALHASISRVKSSELLGGHIFGLRDHSNVGHLPRDLRSR
jgi:probable phosphoglycerate mutase